MKLTILLSAGPDSGIVSCLVGLAKAARAKGHEVVVFAMAAGVSNLAREDFTALVSDDVSITVCEHNRSQYKAPENVKDVKYGSQLDLAAYAQDCDRFISFT